MMLDVGEATRLIEKGTSFFRVYMKD